jgi:hypothetical protein
VASRLEHLYGRRDLVRIVPRASGGVEVRLDLPVSPASRASGTSGRMAGAGV